MFYWFPLANLLHKKMEILLFVCVLAVRHSLSSWFHTVDMLLLKHTIQPETKLRNQSPEFFLDHKTK